jgi:hypothetical protein
MYWQLLLAKEIATQSPPHSQHERQLSINDVLLSILSKLCSEWLQTSIHEILAALNGKNNSAMLPAAS